MRWICLLATLAACAAPETIVVEATADAPLAEFVELLDDARVSLQVVDAPGTAGGGLRIAVEAADWTGCAECYAIDGEGRRWTVRGGLPLGVQYGVAEVLESAGYRFFHPHHTAIPRALPTSLQLPPGERSPEMALRGLQMHTLHPIEGYFDFWEPDARNVQHAARVADWVIKNRGNHLQWVGLEDILLSGGRAAAWQAHTAAILEGLHARGLTASLGIQLFGSGNLQHAFDLIDSENGDVRAEIARRLRIVTEATPFDGLNLSFGEFADAEPDAFLGWINTSWDVLQEVSPGTWMSTLLHVGADLRVEYEGEDWLYYLLAVRADPAITPHVHTVMHFTLHEPTLGAYHHEDFAEHRALLLDRLAAGEPVAYFPESAYWVAFDSPIPLYLPIYVRSRWADLDQIRRDAQAQGSAGLDQHVLFSSGWEWGYWQNDVATLRSCWKLPGDFGDLFDEMFAPWGAGGAELAGVLRDAAAGQQDALVGDALSAWMASHDSTMEIGYALDIVSQPRRPLWDEVLAGDGALRTRLREETLPALTAFAEASEGWIARAEAAAQGMAGAADAPDPARWTAEIVDGLQIDAVRARYMELLLGAALDAAEGLVDATWEAEADALLDQARSIVDRRHGALHDPDPEQLVIRGENSTIYQYGYLIRSDELCFWAREKAQLLRELGDGPTAPGCAL